ncbi:MAG: hypothetical protein RIC35_21650 [Marinoscillum sp.]
MGGAGFMSDMNNSVRNNRGLLKGNDAAAYRNFDSKSYKTSLKNPKAPTFKTATPEYLSELKRQLQVDNLRMATIRRRVIIYSIIGAAICMALIFLVKF